VLKAMYNSAIQFPDPAHSELAIWGNKERGFLPPKWGAGYLADKPERLDAYELQSIHYIGNSRLAVNVFYQNLQDVIAWYKPWTNMADLSGYGLEADFRWPINDRLTLWSNASLQRTKIDMRDKPGLYSYRDQYSTEAEYVVGVPGITANAGADIKITDDITFTTTIRYLSEMEYKRKWLALRKTHDHWNDWDVIRHEFYVDMSVLWENIGVDGLDFRVSAQNILGNRHLLPRQREVGDYGAEGPSLFATLMFSW
jgi:outer membrane receptor protein involved in Fe transport